MKTTRLARILGSAMLLLGFGSASIPSARAQGQVIQRDLQEWLSVQGTFGNPRGIAPNTPRIFGLGNQPDINGDGVADGPSYFIWWDYAGVLSRSTYTKPNGDTVPVPGGGTLGPSSVSGTVKERPVGDGWSEVTVALDVKDALVWVAQFNRTTGVIGQRVFGHTEAEVAAGGTRAFADGQYTVKFLHPTGAPFIDLVESNSKGRFHESFLVLHGEGFFTEHFSSDVEEGTPGMLRWGKPFITVPADANADNGAASAPGVGGFPNDEFHMFPVGKK